LLLALYGEWPTDTVCGIDGGPEYGKQFRQAVREEEPKIKFVVNPPGNPNSAGFVENNNRVVRGVMRRYTRAHKAQGGTPFPSRHRRAHAWREALRGPWVAIRPCGGLCQCRGRHWSDNSRDHPDLHPPDRTCIDTGCQTTCGLPRGVASVATQLAFYL
jgi:hypothetical protein